MGSAETEVRTKIRTPNWRIFTESTGLEGPDRISGNPAGCHHEVEVDAQAGLHFEA